MLASLSMLKQAIFFLQLSQSITRTPRLLKLDDDPAPAGEALCIGSSTQLLMDDYMYLVQSSSGLAQSMHSPELARVAVTADAPREQNRTVEDCKLYGIRFSELSLSSRKLEGRSKRRCSRQTVGKRTSGLANEWLRTVASMGLGYSLILDTD